MLVLRVDAKTGEMVMTDQEPLYRRQRIAIETQFAQMAVNVLRRLVGLPVLRTGAQAYDEAFARAGAND